jgi:WD40 repeat protein
MNLRILCIQIFTLILMGVVLAQDAYIITSIGQLPGSEYGITALSLSPDSKTLVSTGDSTIWAWDLQTGREKYRFGVIAAGAQVSFSPNGKYLSVGLWTHNVEIRDGGSGKLLYDIDDFPDYVLDTSFSPDSNYLAVASGEFLYIWDVLQHKFSQIVDLRNEFTSFVHFNHDNSLVAAASANGFIYFIDPKTGATVKKLRGNTDVVRQIRFDKTGKNLVSCGDDGNIYLWEVSTSKQIASTQVTRRACYRGLKYSADGKFIFAGLKGEVKIFRADDLKEIASFKPSKSNVVDLEVSPDTRTFYTAHIAESLDDPDSNIKVWNISGIK